MMRYMGMWRIPWNHGEHIYHSFSTQVMCGQHTLSFDLSFCLSIFLSFYFYLSIFLSIYISVFYLSTSLSLYLFLSIYLFIYQSSYLSTVLSIYLSNQQCANIVINRFSPPGLNVLLGWIQHVQIWTMFTSL